MAKRTISIARLKVGMYLIGVDRSWLQTLFHRHKFKITNQSEIDALWRAGIVEVTIDTEQGLDVVDHKPASATSVETIRVKSFPAMISQAPLAVLSSRLPAIMLAENLAKATQRRTEWVYRLNGLFEQTCMTGLVQYDAACSSLTRLLVTLLIGRPPVMRR